MCTTRRPAASNACARASTSITSKGSISAARRAVSLSMTVRDYNFLVDEQLKKNALEYHRRKPAGKISVLPTKQLTNQRDLGLAYTPGVAAACEEIVRDPAQAFDMTSRANLIAVVTNGTAVLGLGAIGPLAAKPVMEGKSVLFKKFAGIDCFDIELDERDPDKLVDIIAALEPTFGGINLEDIRAPECFTIERKLRSRMKIPVFHDDQHGTAITVAAAIFNGLKVVGKRIEEVKLVTSGAGAAALACLDLLVKMGLPLASITVTDINTEMELAAAHAIAALAQAETSEQVALAYGIESISFGPEYIIPRPFDPRLIARVAPAVAKAAIDSGVATRPIADLDAYRDSMTQYVYHFGLLMKPVFSAAKAAPRRVAYAEGEDERVLRAVQIVIDEGLARPTLIGRPQVIEQRLERLGLRVRPGKEFELVNPESDSRYRDYWTTYQQLAERKGVSPDYARIEMRLRDTLIGAMMMYKGEVDGMLCGTSGTHARHLHYVDQVIGLRPGVRRYAAMNALILPTRTVFICDTYVTADPDAENVAEMTLLAAEEVRRFGLTPKVALLSASNFGSVDIPSAAKMRRALQLIAERAPQLEADGEMHGDAALSEEIRLRVLPRSRLRGEANLLVMPTLDAANIAFNLLKTASGGGVTIRPILLGAPRPVHILTPSATVRRVVNMTAVTVAGANAPRGQEQSLF